MALPRVYGNFVLHLRNSTILKRCISLSPLRRGDEGNKNVNKFDEKMLEYLACPLSKKPLRFDPDKNELICDEICVAYPIVNGIPNLVPQDARMTKTNQPININDPS